ncbi:hypothetical protein K505DRAFT_122885 [Melanomma pulvis-pyrius CBS 109.77]|uniref:Uncharacterized protein n=1 Tax=Melanomma pulvis-pyrius CBS 109.77 TaxID=1314802 RepID=A0A6A6XNZ6_9PLEO|nr:hypothetical protein K505DRAFT_122885 [Melanomma pulvis-pyrius CBS 109.77]
MDQHWSSYFLLLLLVTISAILTQAISPSQPTNSHAISAATLGFSPAPTDPPYLMDFASPSERQDLRRLAARQRGPGVCAYVNGIQGTKCALVSAMSCELITYSLVVDMQSWNGMRGQRQWSRGLLSSGKYGELRVADNMSAVHKFGILRHVLSEQPIYPEMVR